MKRLIFTLIAFCMVFTQTNMHACPILVVEEDTLSFLQSSIVDEENEPLFSATIFLKQNGVRKAAKMSDFDGKFKLGPVAPGTYDLIVKYVGYPDVAMQGIVLKPGKTIILPPIKMHIPEGWEEMHVTRCYTITTKPNKAEKLKAKITGIITAIQQRTEQVFSKDESKEITVEIFCGASEESIETDDKVNSVVEVAEEPFTNDFSVRDTTILMEPYATATTIIRSLNVSIFPNPTFDKITLTSSLLINEPVQVQILDAAGKQVLQQQIDFRNQSSYTLDLGNYRHGTYFFRMQYMGEVHVEKVIKLQ